MTWCARRRHQKALHLLTETNDRQNNKIITLNPIKIVTIIYHKRNFSTLLEVFTA